MRQWLPDRKYGITVAIVIAAIACVIYCLSSWKQRQLFAFSNANAEDSTPFNPRSNSTLNISVGGMHLEPELTDAQKKQRDYNLLLEQSPTIVLDMWLASVKSKGLADPNVRLQLEAFKVIMRKTQYSSDSNYTSTFINLLQSIDYTTDIRTAFINALGETNSVSGTQALLQSVLLNTDKELKPSLLQAIAKLGKGGHEAGKNTTDLEPVLDSFSSVAFQSGNEDFAAAIGCALANTGTAEATRIAFNLDFNSTVDFSKSSKDELLNALEHISNPAAIPTLSLILSTDKDNGYIINSQMDVAGRALAIMGTVESTRAVLDQLVTAPDQAAPIAEEWLGNIRTPTAYSVIGNYLQNAPFSSQAVKEAIKRDYDQNMAVSK